MSTTRPSATLDISAERIQNDVEALRRITAPDGPGVTRLCYSDEDVRARAYLVERMREIGLVVRVDAAGNVIGRIPGIDDGMAVVATGSHADSVPQGGPYDGVAGVAAALEVAHCFQQAGVRARRPLEFFVFSAEESGRFPTAAHRLGSRAMAGSLGDLNADGIRDRNGVSLSEALRSCGFDAARLGEAALPPGALHAFVELHIEQGSVLHKQGIPAAAVSTIVGSTRMRVDLFGRADHSGGTAMADRLDALCGGAEIVLAVEATAKQAGGALVATVGLVEAHPGAISIVPGHCVLGIDIRDTVAGRKREAKDRIMRAIEDIARRRGLRHEVTVGRDEEPCPMTSRIIDLTVESAAAVEVPFTVIESRTGHDTASLASLCQTGMIMVRNRSGRSHSPDEDVDASDIAAGARVLGEVLLRLADEAESE